MAAFDGPNPKPWPAYMRSGDTTVILTRDTSSTAVHQLWHISGWYNTSLDQTAIDVQRGPSRTGERGWFRRALESFRRKAQRRVELRLLVAERAQALREPVRPSTMKPPRLLTSYRSSWTRRVCDMGRRWAVQHG